MFKRFLATTLAATFAAASAHAAIPLRPQLDVTNYIIHAEIDPATGLFVTSSPSTPVVTGVVAICVHCG